MECVHVTPAVFGYCPDADPSSVRADLPIMSRELPAVLPGLGWNVTVVSAVPLAGPVSGSLAKHITPLHAHTADHDLELDVMEGSLGASHARLVLLGTDPRPDVHPGADLLLSEQDAERQLTWTAEFGAAVAALFERLGLQPDVLHLHGEAIALATVLPQPRQALVLSIYDPQQDAAFSLERWRRLTEPLGWKGPEGAFATASQAAVAMADLVLLPSPGARLQLRLTKRRLVLKDALLAHERVYGVLGGVDRGQWNPATDPALPARFGPGELEGKQVCRRRLQDRAGLAPRKEVLLAAATLGLVPADGVELLVEAAEDILDMDVQLAVYVPEGTTPPPRLERLAQSFPNRMALLPAREFRLADVLAGADAAIQAPSWAPWGRFVQLGMAYGAIPVVRATGGLDDLVVDWDSRTKTGGGFKFRTETVQELLSTLLRARETFLEDPEGWHGMMHRNMLWVEDWDSTARRIHELYLDVSGFETERAEPPEPQPDSSASAGA